MRHHRLSEKNLDTMRGVCDVCGPVDLVFKRNRGRRLPMCATARRQQRRSEPSRHVDYHDYDKRRGPHGLLGSTARQLRIDIGSCQICGSQEKLCIDHDHDSGDIRGVLCNPCNRILGMMEDDPERFERAATYLRNPPIGKTVADVEAGLPVV